MQFMPNLQNLLIECHHMWSRPPPVLRAIESPWMHGNTSYEQGLCSFAVNLSTSSLDGSELKGNHESL